MFSFLNYSFSQSVLPATEVCGFVPVLMSMNVPVPIVIFTSPLSKQHSPNMAACWSAICGEKENTRPQDCNAHIHSERSKETENQTTELKRSRQLTTDIIGMATPNIEGSEEPKLWLEGK